MVKRRSKNILKSRNIRNKRSKIRRNRRGTNHKRKTKKYRRIISGGGKTIREIYDNFKKYNNTGMAKRFETSKGDWVTIRGGKVPTDFMNERFKDILKNVSPYTYTGNEEMYEKYDKNDEKNDVKKKIYEIFGFNSVEEFEENRERLRQEAQLDGEFGYLPIIGHDPAPVERRAKSNQDSSILMPRGPARDLKEAQEDKEYKRRRDFGLGQQNKAPSLKDYQRHEHSREMMNYFQGGGK